jgi:hypothetical protein
MWIGFRAHMVGLVEQADVGTLAPPVAMAGVLVEVVQAVAVAVAVEVEVAVDVVVG